MKYLSNVTTLKFFTEKCSGCWRCIEVCPHRVFVMNGKKAAIGDIDMCMECGACMMNCAFGAISVDSGVGCASAIINGMLTGTEPSCDCTGSESKSSCC